MIDRIDSVARHILMTQNREQAADTMLPDEEVFRPTLVIGLGGTGTLVVKRLKRLILEKFGDERTELFQLLALDTEPETLKYYQRLEVDEFINLAETRILGNKVIEAMIDPNRKLIYESLQTWWPTQEDGQGPFWPGDITSGAKATRCVGRLALWCRGLEVYRAIERRFDRALQIRGLRRTDIPATGNAAKVFLVCSLAGGTGSGIFLDVAYMIRQILDRVNMTSFITGLLLADAGPFAKIIQEEGLLRRMNANIYAAMCELDWFMGGHQAEAQPPSRSRSLYQLHYLDQLRIQSDAKPFDVCYLLSSMNEHGRRLRHLADLTEMMAQEVWLEIATPLGRTGRSALDNVERLSHFSQYGPRPLAYSSFAVSSLNLTSELMRHRCTLNLAERITAVLTESNPDDPVALPVQVKEQLSDWPLEINGAAILLQRRADSELTAILTELAFPSGLEGAKYLDELTRIQERLRIEIEDYVRPGYNEVQERLGRGYCQNLSDAIQTMLASGEVSLAQLTTLVQAWLKEVTSTGQTMEEERRAAQHAADEAQEQSERLLTQLQQELMGPDRKLLVFTTHKEARIASVAQAALGGLAEWSKCLLEHYQWQALSDTFSQMERHLRRLRDNSQRLRERLIPLRGQILERQREIKARLEEGSRLYQLEFEVLDASDVDALTLGLWDTALLEPMSRAILSELELLDSGPGREVVSGEGIIQCLYDSANAFLDSKNLFDILHRIHDESESGIDRQMKKLVEYAAPFWHLTLTDCPEVTEWSVISLVGYAGASASTGGSFFEKTLEKIMDRYTTVEVDEPNRVFILNTKHGVPAFALSLTNGMMRDAYYTYRKAWIENKPGFRPVHASQEWASLPDLSPAPPPG